LRSPRPIAARSSPEREKTCLVDSHGDLATDDSEYVISAFEECNDGGREYIASTSKIRNPDIA
jgi:galacturan 1,4-alpha-galacturonidase